MTFRFASALLAACLLSTGLVRATRAQTLPGTALPPAATGAEPPRDALGRSSPRGAVVGFLGAARSGDYDLARHYLNTKADAHEGAELARQLFLVLDVRLPPRIRQLSDAPEGSRANPLTPDQEVVGTISGRAGNLDIVVERVSRPREQPIWLFSRKTLQSTPALYAELTEHESPLLPSFLVERRIAGIRLFEWFAILLGLPAFYIATVLLNRALAPLMAVVWRRLFGAAGPPPHDALPAPARLLLVALAGRWLVLRLPLSLLIRQVLGNVATLMAIGASAWLLIRLNDQVEQHLRRRIPAANFPAAVSLLRAGRRVVDLVVLLLALLATLRHYGVDPTPILAGLGVGGIAVALAAQKTLENVIAGASLIFDQAVRVGDYLKVGEIEGTVEHIGLRSTRIRTLGRTVVSVPNGQIANMSLETLSERDKFWFHPMVGLRYETTSGQLRAVVDGIRDLLTGHPAVDPGSVRVRFLRLGAFSLDVEVFAYVTARDWSHFLEIQEELLFNLTAIVTEAGTAVAFPSQTMYVVGTPAGAEAVVSAERIGNRTSPQ